MTTPLDVIEGRADWCLVTGSCLDPVTGLASLPERSVDHVITDPPYTQQTSENMRSRKDRSDGGAYIGDPGRRRISFDGIDGLEGQIVAGTMRIAERWCVIWCALEQIGEYRRAAKDGWVRSTVWVRTNSAPQFTGDRPGQACEGVAIIHRPGRKRWNRGGDSLVWTGPTINAVSDPDRGKIDHPTPKPLWLMEDAIRAFTDPGEIIVDPFTGSGTTGVACRRLGRRFIGWELNPEWAEKARQRIASTSEQPDLLATEAFQREAKKKRKQTALPLGEGNDGR